MDQEKWNYKWQLGEGYVSGIGARPQLFKENAHAIWNHCVLNPNLGHLCTKLDCHSVNGSHWNIGSEHLSCAWIVNRFVGSTLWTKINAAASIQSQESDNDWQDEYCDPL